MELDPHKFRAGVSCIRNSRARGACQSPCVLPMAACVYPGENHFRERMTSMEAYRQTTSRSIPTVAQARPRAAGRLLFIDNLRVFLTLLVILFHLMITYAGTGSW